MNKFQSLFLGATMAASTMTAVAFAPSAAQAISLAGELELDGNVQLSRTGNQVLVDFTSVNTVTAVPTFSNLLPPLGTGVPGNLPISIGNGAGISIQDLILTRVSGTTYQTAAVTTSFLNFGQRTLGSTTAALTFNLNPAQFFVQTTANGGLAVSLLGTTGTWQFGNDIIGTSQITANDIGRTGAYTITATAVPEPLTMGGLALGAGFGAFLKKRYAKKDKELAKV
ncbi:MAG: PEP-CTERM sorting domain-containing protein [Trichormus sp.]